jgi:hypothetical protein
MVNLNSVEGIESLIEKKTKPLDKQIKELTNLVNKLKESISATRSCTELRGEYLQPELDKYKNIKVEQTKGISDM